MKNEYLLKELPKDYISDAEDLIIDIKKERNLKIGLISSRLPTKTE